MRAFFLFNSLPLPNSTARRTIKYHPPLHFPPVARPVLSIPHRSCVYLVGCCIQSSIGGRLRPRRRLPCNVDGCQYGAIVLVLVLLFVPQIHEQKAPALLAAVSLFPSLPSLSSSFLPIEGGWWQGALLHPNTYIARLYLSMGACSCRRRGMMPPHIVHAG
jgi:hypothetical protein